MLELYQAYADYRDLMVLIEELVAGAGPRPARDDRAHLRGRPLDLTPPWRRATMTELIERGDRARRRRRTPPATSCARWPTDGGAHRRPRRGGRASSCSRSTRRRPRPRCGARSSSSTTRPRCRRWPGATATTRDLVERFEPIVAGRELGNAFTRADRSRRPARPLRGAGRRHAAGDDEAMAVDEDYLRALEYGLPPDRRVRHRHRPAGHAAGATWPTSARSSPSRPCDRSVDPRRSARRAMPVPV